MAGGAGAVPGNPPSGFAWAAGPAAAVTGGPPSRFARGAGPAAGGADAVPGDPPSRFAWGAGPAAGGAGAVPGDPPSRFAWGAGPAAVLVRRRRAVQAQFQAILLKGSPGALVRKISKISAGGRGSGSARWATPVAGGRERGESTRRKADDERVVDEAGRYDFRAPPSLGGIGSKQ